jgi:hypothetical protein
MYIIYRQYKTLLDKSTIFKVKKISYYQYIQALKKGGKK